MSGPPDYRRLAQRRKARAWWLGARRSRQCQVRANGNMNVITTIERGAVRARRSSVAAVAALVMYIETPLDDTSALAVASKPASASAAHQSSSDSKSTGTRWRCSGTSRPLRVGVETSAEEDVLADALLDDEVLDEPGPGDDGSAVGTGAGRMHVRTVPPPVLGVGEGQTDLVVDQVRRIIDLHVQSAPERCAHRAAVGRRTHDCSFAWRLQGRPSASHTVIRPGTGKDLAVSPCRSSFRMAWSRRRSSGFRPSRTRCEPAGRGDRRLAGC